MVEPIGDPLLSTPQLFELFVQFGFGVKNAIRDVPPAFGSSPPSRCISRHLAPMPITAMHRAFAFNPTLRNHDSRYILFLGKFMLHGSSSYFTRFALRMRTSQAYLTPLIYGETSSVSLLLSKLHPDRTSHLRFGDTVGLCRRSRSTTFNLPDYCSYG